MKSVPMATSRPSVRATPVTIGSEKRRATAMISLKTKISAPAARPRKEDR
jgi:hypothetical protein